MNFRILFKKQEYALSQDFASYDDLIDQIKSNVPNIPDLFSITYLGNQNTKMNINTQDDI